MKKELKTLITTFLLGGTLLAAVPVSAAPANETKKNNAASTPVNAASVNKTKKGNVSSAFSNPTGSYYSVTLSHKDVNLRRHPNSSDILLVLEQGTLLQVYTDQYESGWLCVFVETSEGPVCGYIRADLL